MAKPVRQTPPGSSPPVSPGAGPQAAPAPDASVAPTARPAAPLATPAAAPLPAAPQPIPLTAAGARPVPIDQAQAGIGTLRGQQSMAAKVKGEPDEEEELAGHDENPLVTWCKDHRDWLTSFAVHMLLLVILGLIMLPGLPESGIVLMSAPYEDPLPDDDEDQDADFDISKFDEAHPNEVLDIPPEAPNVESLVVNMLEEGAPAPRIMEPDFRAEIGQLIADEATDGSGRGESDAGAGTGLGGRGERRAGAGGRGASKASEDAVELALKWLADHQQPDGSWSFDHTHGSCNGRCPNPGTGAVAKNGATGLALLPFLGAGYTHLDGKYKRTVAHGLQYLIRAQQHTPNGGSFHEPEGRMYSHGLAALALCEAHAMALQKGSSGTKAGELSRAATAAIKYIEYAQADGGGWRYEPKEAGDTSVLSWQLMALKSGSMAYLPVSDSSFKGAGRFLDSVQAGTYREKYGYTGPGETSGTTAIGLLCRMYLGWKRTEASLERGIEYLSETGPSTGNMYYNFYATQAVFHFTNAEGERWRNWNERMRDHLVAQQVKGEHVGGSWFMRGGEDLGVGGRLYYTCLSAMTLEVYYRHMPLYRNLGD